MYFFPRPFLDLLHALHGKPILVLHFVPLGGTRVEGASCHCSMEFCETDDFAELKLLPAMLISISQGSSLTEVHVW